MGLKGLKTGIKSLRNTELEAGQESGVVELTKTNSECKESHLPPQTVSGGARVWEEDVHMGIQRPEAYLNVVTWTVTCQWHPFLAINLGFFCLKIKKKIREYFHAERDQDCPLLSLLIMCHKPFRHKVWRKEQLELRPQFLAPVSVYSCGYSKG